MADARRHQADQELVEHVDLDGNVIEIVTRAEIRAANLAHRCTYVTVVDRLDRVVVHQRADWKDVYPGWWDIAFGGICDVGEPWEEAARRELAEEAGLVVDELIELGAVVYRGHDGTVVGRSYLARTDEEPTCDDGEVVAVDRVPRHQLAAWADGRSVCSDSRAVVLPLIQGLELG